MASKQTNVNKQTQANEHTQETMTESVEMYLVSTMLMRKGEQPVQLSVLADKLSVSPVSANEMCHKLSERGLVEYQPYKGIVLTDAGEQFAQRVLERRRIWEIFLVEKLGIEAEEAEDIACQLEHITSDKLIHSLSHFLQDSNCSLPNTLVMAPNRQLLTSITASQCGTIVTTAGNSVESCFLHAQGLEPGKPIEVVAVGNDGTRLVMVNGNAISLAASIAALITVVPNAPPPL